MNKKGFTLVEMIVTITLLCTILLLIVPSILSQLSSKTSELENTEEQIILEAAKAYTSKYSEKFSFGGTNNVHCIELKELKKEGLYTPSSNSKFFSDKVDYYVKVEVTSETKNYSLENECH